AEQCRAAAEVLAATGRDLQHHASDLAELAGRARALTELAEQHGLRADAGGVAPQWGITGEADAGRTAQQGQLADHLESEFRTLQVLATRRRDALTAAMAQATEALTRSADIISR
ncbi:hypothetical protein, partial [Kribbia dieselivorans]|uniref:hypothetical protein n=1 Tax=Kribbia dieselivorans TaxID=331526 RepID=UPI00147061AC